MKVAQQCPPRTVHGILQARILEWVAFPFSRGSSRPRNWTQVSRIAGGFFTNWAIREAPTGMLTPREKEFASSGHWCSFSSLARGRHPILVERMSDIWRVLCLGMVSRLATCYFISLSQHSLEGGLVIVPLHRGEKQASRRCIWIPYTYTPNRRVQKLSWLPLNNQQCSPFWPKRTEWSSGQMQLLAGTCSRAEKGWAAGTGWGRVGGHTWRGFLRDQKGVALNLTGFNLSLSEGRLVPDL